MNEIVTLPNILSLLRAPLALCLFSDSISIRSWAVSLAMMTDFLDGFLARRLGQQSKAGTILDPVMDKLFVFIALIVFFMENKLTSLQAAIFLFRDCSLILFAFYHLIRGTLKNIEIQSIWSGKVTTFCQFIVLACLCLDISPSPIFFGIMAISGLASLPELIWAYLVRRQSLATEEP